MKTLHFYKNPKNDEILEWNESTGRYQLTIEHVKSLVDEITYKSDSMLQRRIKDTSVRIYTYIINHSNTANRSVINAFLNHTEEGRKFLAEILESQMRSDMQYGTNDIVRRPVLNSQTNSILDREEIRRNSISVETEEMIDNSVVYFGINICYAQPYPWYLFNMVRPYED